MAYVIWVIICWPIPVSLGCEYGTSGRSGRFRLSSFLGGFEACDGVGEAAGFEGTVTVRLLEILPATAPRFALNDWTLF